MMGPSFVRVYHKPTHTDQYLNWDSNHYLEHKMSVVRILLWQAGKLVSNPCDRDAEIQHVKSVQRSNRYKPWAFTIPYVSELCLQRVFKCHDVQSYHKPINTLRSLLVNSVGSSTPWQTGNATTSTSVKWPGILGVQFKKHTDGKNPNSAVCEHIMNTGHCFSLDDTI